MIASAWAPAHITGFFEIHWHDDPTRAGSRGCGFTLTRGVTTEAKRSNTESQVRLDGRVVEAKTTHSVISSLTDLGIDVHSSLEIPLGGGMGASGAGALSTALALNELLKLNKTYFELARTAHVAEVLNKTGLGDVTGQTYGGLVLRLEPGAPGICVVDKIPIRDVEVAYVSLGSLSTDGIIVEPDMIQRINKAGRSAIREIVRRPSLEDFMRLSRQFSVETDLISDRALDAIEAVEAAGGQASMAMLGDLVFAIDGKDVLAEFGEVVRARICHHGARLL